MHISRKQRILLVSDPKSTTISESCYRGFPLWHEGGRVRRSNNSKLTCRIEGSEPVRQCRREQRERDRKRQGLLLSRTRLTHQLETCQNPRHRQILLDGIAELDRQLASLE